MRGVNMLGGLHHVTALAGAAQTNLDFYTGFWGLRLVKRTVNFDDPATHHFYYSSSDGAPGTLATFFPWGRFRPSRRGAGQVTAMAFAVPEESLTLALPTIAQDLEAWRQRTEGASLPSVSSGTRFGENVLTILDPDGVAVEMIARAGTTAAPPRCTPSRRARQLSNRPRNFLQFLGFLLAACATGNRTRFGLPGHAWFRRQCCTNPPASEGRMGAGMIHHVAFRVADEATQIDWRASAGSRPSGECGGRSPVFSLDLLP